MHFQPVRLLHQGLLFSHVRPQLHFLRFVTIRRGGIIAWESLEARDVVLLPDEDLMRSELSEGISPGLRGLSVLASILQGTILMSEAVTLDAMPPTPSQAPQDGE